MTKVNKQINKQQEVAHAGVVQCCTIYGVCYAMCQSTWKSIRDASEKHRVQYAGSYSDNKLPMTGRTLLEGGWCQNMTLCIELCTLLMHLRSSSTYSDALHTRLHMLCNSTPPPASTPLHMLPPLVCLFVCFPFWIVSINWWAVDQH